MTQDHLKEIGFDKANAQNKAVTFFKTIAENNAHHKIKDIVKLVQSVPYM